MSVLTAKISTGGLGTKGRHCELCGFLQGAVPAEALAKAGGNPLKNFN